MERNSSVCNTIIHLGSGRSNAQYDNAPVSVRVARYQRVVLYSLRRGM